MQLLYLRFLQTCGMWCGICTPLLKEDASLVPNFFNYRRTHTQHISPPQLASKLMLPNLLPSSRPLKARTWMNSLKRVMLLLPLLSLLPLTGPIAPTYESSLAIYSTSYIHAFASRELLTQTNNPNHLHSRMQYKKTQNSYTKQIYDCLFSCSSISSTIHAHAYTRARIFACISPTSLSLNSLP